jgi:hypothetical protein
MSWFRLDDKFHSNAKVMAAGNAAVGLYARCGTWCADHGKEGVIPSYVAHAYGSKREIATLIATRLWVEVDEGYKMPDYLDFNLSNDEVEDRRAKRAEAGRQGGIKSGQVRKKASKDEANASASAEANTNDSRTESNPYPSLPVPLEKISLPTKSVTPDPAGGEDSSSRRDQVIADYHRIERTRMETAGETIKSEAGLKRYHAEQVTANPDLEHWLALFPTAPPDAIAAWLLGDKGSMRYYPRSDELATVTELRPA